MRKLLFACLAGFLFTSTQSIANEITLVDLVIADEKIKTELNQLEKTQLDLSFLRELDRSNLKIIKVIRFDEDFVCSVLHAVYYNGRFIGEFFLNHEDDDPACGGVIFHMGGSNNTLDE